MIAIDKKIIRAYAFKNALEHEGKAVAGSVISGLFNHGLTKDKIKDIMKDVNSVLKEVNSLSFEKQSAEFEKLKDIVGHRAEREGLPELENVSKDGVIMRFAPAPSGPLHIGHIISNMSSSLYVKKYSGKFYVRLEDTDPERIDVNAYDSIKKDCDWLFGNVHEYIIQSDRIEIYYKYAEELVKKGAAYVCVCDNEKFKELINKKKPCPCRAFSADDNLKKWKKMLSKGKDSYKEGRAVLRFKASLDNPNPALRDFPIARINLKKHPLQGNKYKVWPLMNLSVSVDDIEYKMTHVIRGKDHKDNAEKQKMIYKALGFENKFPVTFFVGRIKFTDVVLSKRKISKAISEGEYEGWEDVRLPTIASLRNRGYQPEAFAEMAIQRGLSEVDKVISQKDFFDVLNGFNREILRNKTRKASFDKIGSASKDGGHTAKDANIIILMPDASKVYGKSEVKAKKDEIVYFTKIGYARFNGLEGKTSSVSKETEGKASSVSKETEGKGKSALQIFWFTHE